MPGSTCSADGGAVIRDLDSKNGTFVGGRRIREAAVCGFTMIAFGSVQAVIQPADPARTDVLLGPQPAGERPAGIPGWRGTDHPGAPPPGAAGGEPGRRPPFPGRGADHGRGGRRRAGAPLARRAPGGTGRDPPLRTRGGGGGGRRFDAGAVPRSVASSRSRGRTAGRSVCGRRPRPGWSRSGRCSGWRSPPWRRARAAPAPARFATARRQGRTRRRRPSRAGARRWRGSTAGPARWRAATCRC